MQLSLQIKCDYNIVCEDGASPQPHPDASIFPRFLRS